MDVDIGPAGSILDMHVYFGRLVHLLVSREASQIIICFALPPVTEKTSGIKDKCSISRICS